MKLSLVSLVDLPFSVAPSCPHKLSHRVGPLGVSALSRASWRPMLRRRDLRLRVRRRSPLHSAEAVADREAAAAALAAAMEVDARNNKMPPPPTAPHTGSPAKRTKHASQAGPPGVQPSPMFGSQVPKAGDEPVRTEQDRTRGSARGGGAGLANPGSGTGRREPVHHHIGEGDPPWLAGLRQTLLGDMHDMKEGQREILTSVQQQREEFRSKGRRLETVEERQGEMLAFRDDMERRMRDMQTELREVRSRSVSPAPTPRNAGGARAGTGQAPSPAASSTTPYVVDDFQLVLGGYTDAKREEIQNEVRGLFEAAHALPLLRNIITPYVRSNICRIELLYLDEGLSARRKVQQSVIVGLRAQLEARNKKSQIAGQERAALWVSRNRGVEERNRLRALLGLRDFGLRFLPPGDVDFDWKGRVWFRNCQVLFHCDREEPSPHALMFLSARGDETGWWTSTPTISRILGMSESQVRTELQGRGCGRGPGPRQVSEREENLRRVSCACATWNLHGKPVESLTHLFRGLIHHERCSHWGC